jgi:O-antigen/teichoic acid export membrane protein
MGIYLPATVAVRLISFARVLLLTWWMLPQQFGLLNMILLAVNVLTPVCSLGLNEAVARYVPQEENRGSLRVFAGRCLRLLLIVTGASVLLMCVFSRPLGDFFFTQIYADAALREEFRPSAPMLAIVSAAVTGLVILYFYLLAVYKGLRMFKAVAVMEMVHATLFLAACALAGATHHRAAITMTVLYGLSLAIPIAYFGGRFARRLGRWASQQASPEEDKWAGKLLRFSMWTTLAGLTWQVLMYYPTWYLNKVHGHHAVAVFSAPRQIGQFVLIGAVAVVTVVTATVTRTWESRGRAEAERQLSLVFRGTGVALLLVCAVLSLARNWIMRMFRPDYMPGADVLPLHLLFFLIASYLAFLPIHFHLIERTRHLFWPVAVGVACNALYAFWLAGPGQAAVRGTSTWHSLASTFSFGFVTGFSGPLGLESAAWCGVLAIATALALCVMLIRAECTRLDRGSYVVIASAALLGLNSWLLAAGIALVLVLALRTEMIFSPNERARVTRYAVRVLKSSLSRGGGRRNNR